MNGRVERFFGMLKQKLNHWAVDSAEGLQESLGQFRYWYNDIRPHQNLNGCTPAEIWHGINPYATAPKEISRFEAWDGLLVGYYLRR